MRRRVAAPLRAGSASYHRPLAAHMFAGKILRYGKGNRRREGRGHCRYGAGARSAFRFAGVGDDALRLGKTKFVAHFNQ